MEDDIMSAVHSVVFKDSENLDGKCIKIESYDFNQGVDYTRLLKSFISTGFQASSLGDAVEIVNIMLDWRLAAQSQTEDCSAEERDPLFRESVRCKVFLGFTSNLISLGVRDTIQYLAQRHVVWKRTCSPFGHPYNFKLIQFLSFPLIVCLPNIFAILFYSYLPGIISRNTEVLTGNKYNVQVVNRN